jgi:hypothetical protein
MDDGLDRLLGNCPELRSLDMSHSRKVTANVLAVVARNCPRIVYA